MVGDAKGSGSLPQYQVLTISDAKSRLEAVSPLTHKLTRQSFLKHCPIFFFIHINVVETDAWTLHIPSLFGLASLDNPSRFPVTVERVEDAVTEKSAS